MVSCQMTHTWLTILPSQMLNGEIKIGAGGNKLSEDTFLMFISEKNIQLSS